MAVTPPSVSRGNRLFLESARKKGEGGPVLRSPFEGRSSTSGGRGRKCSFLLSFRSGRKKKGKENIVDRTPLLPLLCLGGGKRKKAISEWSIPSAKGKKKTPAQSIVLGDASKRGKTENRSR